MKSYLLLAAAAAIACATPAAAASYPGNSPANFERVLKAAGYAVTAGKDNEGVQTVKVAVDGTNFTIYFYDCTGNRDCMSYQITAGYDLKSPTTAAKMNEWNRTKRPLRAYIDDDGDPFIMMDVSINAAGAASDALILDNVKWFIALMKQFQTFIDW